MIGQSINKGLTKTLRISNSVIVIICLAFAVAASQSLAQRVQLTPEQQLMLDQLRSTEDRITSQVLGLSDAMHLRRLSGVPRDRALRGGLPQNPREVHRSDVVLGTAASSVATSGGGVSTMS